MTQRPPLRSPAAGLFSGTVWRRIGMAAVLAVVVFAGLALYADGPALADALIAFPGRLIPAVLLLTSLNYGLRFVKWQYYLRLLRIEVPRGASLAIFLSGFMMVLTPGKVGELLKSFLLRGAAGTPIARSAPIMFAERLSDGLALVMLAAVGLLYSPGGWPIVVLILLGGGTLVAICQSRRFAEALLSRLAVVGPLRGRIDHLRTLYLSAHALLQPRPLAAAIGLGILSWGGECLAFYLVLRGLGAMPGLPTLLQATFVLATSTLVGASSLLPGGLGAAEGSTLLLLRGTLSPSLASAATILIRFCTLWFGVLIGALAFVLVARRYLASPPGPLPSSLGKEGEGVVLPQGRIGGEA